MSFASAVDHLHALGLELAPDPTAPRRKFDLDHMRVLAHALGDPQTRFPSVLIAGTNGKGSTAATLSSILAASGFRTGLYTSPHLTRVTERIRISAPRSPEAVISTEASHRDAQWRDPRISSFPNPSNFPEIPEPDFARLYFHIDETANRLVSTNSLPHHPSFFETLTALAFLYFAEQKVDIAILEVGLGGRLDATNIVEPILSVITDIALDHQEYLGNTIAEIAREKAGILRPGGTLITLPQHPEANQAIGEAAIALNVRAISAAPYIPGRDFQPLDRVSEPRVPHDQRERSERLSWGESLPQAEPNVRTEGPASRISSGLQPAVSLPKNRGALAPGLSPQPPLPQNYYTLTLDNAPLQVRSPLAGEHQRRNIALAIAAAIELRNHISHKSPSSDPISNQTSNKFTASHLEPENLAPGAWNPVPLSSIEIGIATTSWPGRLEFLPPNLLLDVAHNPAGAWTLRAAISSLPETQPRTLIFSCLRDKDLREMAQILFPLFDSTSNPAPSSNLEPRTLNLVLTPVDSPRAASLESLLAAAADLSIPAHPAHDPAQALALARSLTPASGLILATGSIYLIGALRDLIS